MFAGCSNLPFSGVTMIRHVVVLFLAICVNFSNAGNVPGVTPPFKMITPNLEPGLDKSTGNWVDTNLVTWSKISDIVPDASNAVWRCEQKNQSSPVRWQLPTAEQAENFYKNLHTHNNYKLLTNAGWVFGHIWLTDSKVAALEEKSGVLHLDSSQTEKKYLACVALPQGFDDSGNYFDGELTWAKPQILKNPEGYGLLATNFPDLTATELIVKTARAFCNNLTTNSVKWKLPTTDQLNKFSMELRTSSPAFREKMFVTNQWAQGKFSLRPESMSSTDLTTWFIKDPNPASNPDNEKFYVGMCVRVQIIR